MSVMYLGLTGGIGSGKSTVAVHFAKQGAAVIDSDAISRQLTAVGGAAMPAIAAQFGPDYVQADGALNRAKMRELIFSQAAAKAQLQALLHPLIRQTLLTQARARPEKCVVLDIPLLTETQAQFDWRAELDVILVIDCTTETQIQRVMARSQWSRQLVEQAIAQQATRQQRLAIADLVICNETATNTTLADTVARIVRRFGL